MVTNDFMFHHLSKFRKELLEFICQIIASTYGNPPTNIFFVLKSFRGAAPFGIVLLISTCFPLITWLSSITLSTTAGSAKVINPNPLGFWVKRSFIMTASTISPYFPKYSLKVPACSRA
ncbi:Os08g0320051 [Oryza sativa Japonica Group]|uniref:Os08g0320051 protein n=1 Tax=Oryza sativa subsp. japonica TaxID=39947 RepID=A0A0P0XEK4_ORYSJ|nr:Os08g0320051 [Oryza sativa Japonica Group]